MNADRIVFRVTFGLAASLALISAGMEIAERRMADQHQTKCERQQDEKELISTTQAPGGELLCTYSMNAYGKAKRTRKAT